MNLNGKPSDSLVGLNLENGWIVDSIVKKTPNQTGGAFSSSYIVKDANNKEAFLKAVDFSGALQTNDPMSALQELTSAFLFEKNLLYKCRDRKLNKVVLPICDGKIKVPGFHSTISEVFYIIFELANSDIRVVVDSLGFFDLAFYLRSLHNIAVGIKQLHTNGIAHQDLKPSNILVTKEEISKVSDLGRSSDKNIPFQYDHLIIPGDVNYAPLEQEYNYHFSNDFDEKYASDLYLFGSLFFFYFSGMSARQATITNVLSKFGNNFCFTDFKNDLPVLEYGFAESLDKIKTELDKYCPLLSNDIVCLIKSLCQPDPVKRGYPYKRSSKKYDFSMERYVSKLDLLARKAELGIL